MAGLTVVKYSPLSGAVNSPPMNRPYSGLIVTISRDSGAGAYSQSAPTAVTCPVPPAATGDAVLPTLCHWPPRIFAANLPRWRMRDRQPIMTEELVAETRG